MNKYLLSILFTLFFLPLYGSTDSLCDSLRTQLGNVTTASDSIEILYDIFDNSPRRDRTAVAEELYTLAERDQNVGVQLDLLRQLINLNPDNDSLFHDYLRRAKSLPYSNERNATIVFITARGTTQAARRATFEQCRDRINELIKRSEQFQGQRIETRIELLFALCAYLEQLPNAQIAKDYVTQLGKLIDESRFPLYALQTLYLTQAALTYTATGEHEKAIAADRELLEQIESLDEAYKKKGRIYRDYDQNRYIINRRMLSNFAALTPEEIDTVYNECRRLAQSNPALKADFEQRRTPDLYYAMARKDYATALPLLKKEIAEYSNDSRLYHRLNILEYMIEAAQAVGDKEALLNALLTGRQLRKDEEVRQNTSQFKELREIYENSTERVSRASVEQEKRKVEKKSHLLIRLFGILLLLTLLAFVLYLVYTWRSSRKLNKDLAKTNARLVEERDTLQRTQAEITRMGERAKQADRQKENFIANMSHEVSTPLNAINEYTQLIVDCGDAEKKPYLTRFAEVVKLNTSLLQTLVNDVLDLASVDRGMMKVTKVPVVIGRLASIATDSIKNRVQPGVRLINNIDPDYNQIIVTDSKRVLQVLLNLLGNAAKFTNEGSITLDGWFMEERKIYRFTVTDTGIGIPEGKEEIIFERFEKLNSRSQGLGLGLSVSRLVASLLGGEVFVDRDYRGPGSRFTFYIPVE